MERLPNNQLEILGSTYERSRSVQLEVPSKAVVKRSRQIFAKNRNDYGTMERA